LLSRIRLRSTKLIRPVRGAGPATIHVNRRGDSIALPALALAQMRAPESRSAARLLRTTRSSSDVRLPSLPHLA
jgi:hypothetical protein